MSTATELFDYELPTRTKMAVPATRSRNDSSWHRRAIAVAAVCAFTTVATMYAIVLAVPAMPFADPLF